MFEEALDTLLAGKSYKAPYFDEIKKVRLVALSFFFSS